jgi:hypothetical protein
MPADSQKESAGVLPLPAIAAHLARLSYRPGWTFAVYPGRYEGPHICICAELADSVRPGHVIAVRIDSQLPPFDDVEQFERWLLWRLAIIESHECREWFKRDGVAIVDPHAPDAQHDL